MKRIFSGIQPTGFIHIGNYLGALKQWVKLQDQTEAIFCVVDLHALTIDQDPKKYPEQVMNLAIDYLAIGMDPQKAILFIQSQVREHTELTWIFNTLTPMGELNRMTQYKDKSKQHAQNINVGLFDYPVLMAADILLYKADTVPVGEDQVQHVELTRTIARRFNKKYGQTFPEPKPFLATGARIGGLDGTGKMSKSLNNYVAVFDKPEDIITKFKKATTDSGKEIRFGQDKPEISNLLKIYMAFTDKDEKTVMAEMAGKGYGEFKEILGKTVAEALAPFRAKRQQLEKNPNEIRDILQDGAKRAREIAAATMAEVRDKVGLKI